MRTMTRRDKTILLYVLVCLGTAAAAFLCVFISNLLLKAEERQLYDRPAYEPFTLESGTSVGAPLALSTRIALLESCETEGAQRPPLPDELTEAEANAAVLSAWNRLYMDMVNAAGKDPELEAAINSAGGDVKTSAALRDYLTADGSRYSLWCAQAWMDLSADSAFSLTVYLDSRTGQCMMESAVLYPQDAPLLGLADMAKRLSMGADLSAAKVEETADGQQVTVPLEGGFALLKTINADGGRFTIRITAP